MIRTFKFNGEEINVNILELTQAEVHFEYNQNKYRVKRRSNDTFEMNGTSSTCITFEDQVIVNGDDIDLSVNRLARSFNNSGVSGDMLSPMPGKILKICLNVGDDFSVGDSLIIMEAMKMEHTIKASVAGKISKFLVEEGKLVEGDKELFEFEAKELNE